MKPNPTVAAKTTSEEITALERTLHDTQQRLQVLRGGAADGAPPAGGPPQLSPEAQAALCQSEAALRTLAATQTSILNALPANIALLDHEGVIISVNDRWRRFTGGNGIESVNSDLGQNYLTICDQAQGSFSKEAHQAAAGIRAVLSGESKEFCVEYPCHLPGEQCWFRLMASPLERAGLSGAVIMHINITERKLAEQALRESEERFRGTFEQAAVGIAHVSTEGRFLRVNARLCAMLGFTREEMLRRSFADLTAPEDLVASQEARRALLSGELACYTTEKRYVGKTGAVIWINLVSTLERSATGAADYFISIFEDITPRKEAEAALRLSEQMFANAFTYAAIGIALVSPEGRFLKVNRALSQILGHTEAALLGLTFQELTHPEDLAADLAHGRRLLAGESDSYRMEKRYLHARGHLVWAQLNVSLVRDETGRPVNFISQVQDITDQRSARDAIRTQAHMLDHIGRAVISTDTAGRIIYANQFAGELYGWNSEEMLGRDIKEITVPQTTREQAGEIMARLQQGEDWTGEFLVQHRDGRVFPAVVTNSPLFDERGQLIGIVGISADISARKHAEAKLRQSESESRALAGKLEVERARLVAAQALANVGSWETDLATLIVTWSEETHRIFETSPATFQPTHNGFLDFVHPEDRAAVDAAFVSSIGQPGLKTIEHRVLLPDGRIKFVEERWLTLFGENERPIKAAGTCQDISEHRQAQEEIRRNQALLRMAGRLTRMGAWSVELPEFKLLWSEEVCAIHETLPGFAPTVEEGINYYAPEFRPLIGSAFEKCVSEGTPFDLELQIVTAKNHRVWVRTMGEAVRDASGAIRRVQGAFQDISENKLAEIAIIESEVRFRQTSDQLTTTLESLSDGFFTLDHGWHVTYLNRAAEKMFKMPRAKLLGFGIWEKFPEAARTTLQPEYERALRDGVAVQVETFYHPFDAWYDVRAFPSAQGLAVYFRDITEVRKARDAIHTSEERFRLLAKATNDAIWDWDLSNDALWWNEGFETLFGFRRDEIEPTVASWFNRVHPEDREAITADIHRAIHGSVESWSGEYRFLRMDGSHAFVIERGHIIRDAMGKAVRMIGGMTDITERKKSDERIAEQAALIDQTKDAIIVRDLEHRVVFWSKGAERLYGWTAAEASGRRINELLQQDFAIFEKALDALLKEGTWNGEIRETAKTGVVLTLDARWTLLRDAKGKPKSILTIDTDITERKKIEQQFLRAQRMESIGTLAGGIAHDLNNLLAPISMGVGLMKQFELNPRSLPILDIMERSADRGTNLVKQVLSFARGAEGTRVSLQVRHIIREIESIAENTFPKNISIKVFITADLWLIQADPTQLNQVLMNLCVNARDAMPDGGSIAIAAKNAEIDEQYAVMNNRVPPGRYVLIEVTDTGTGIPREVIDRIFEPFFTTKEIGKGTGLGLSTVLGIVRGHGGFVNVYSEPGKGSTFKVYLPAQSADVANSDPVAEGEKMPRGHGELILVVDDEKPILEITRGTLEAFGYKVITAEDGAQAIALYALQRDQIAVVLTDMMMPVMDGPALIAALRRIRPGVRVIGASGLIANGNVVRATHSGVKHFLAKPYTADTMLVMLRQVLGAGGSSPPM